MALWCLVLLLYFNAVTASTSSVMAVREEHSLEQKLHGLELTMRDVLQILNTEPDAMERQLNRTRDAMDKNHAEMAANFEVLQTRLKTSEDNVLNLQTRLNASEFSLQLMRTDGEARLSAVESRLTASEGLQKEVFRTRDRLTSLYTTVVQPLEERLATSNNHVQELTGKIAEMSANLTGSQNQVEVLQTRLSTSEGKVQTLQTRLGTSESSQQTLKSESKAQLSRVETMVNQLNRKISEQPQVAFSAYRLGDHEYIGPYSSTTTLVYKNVHINFGNAYSTSTGYFRAPFRGVYYFRFTAATYGSSQQMDVYMYKNNQQLIHNYGENNHWGYEYMSNAVIVQMEQGDTVYMRSGGHSSYRLSDSSFNHNTFSGFLLYAL